VHPTTKKQQVRGLVGAAYIRATPDRQNRTYEWSVGRFSSNRDRNIEAPRIKARTTTRPCSPPMWLRRLSASYSSVSMCARCVDTTVHFSECGDDWVEASSSSPQYLTMTIRTELIHSCRGHIRLNWIQRNALGNAVRLANTTPLFHSKRCEKCSVQLYLT
jgi:hypothetical protein